MRLDLFLVSSRLLKRRSLAQEFCEKGLVSVNGLTAKSAKELKPGDTIEIKRRGETTRVRVITLPATKHVAKTNANSLFELLDTTKVSPEFP